MDYINMRYEKKEGREFVATDNSSDAALVYDYLAHDLIAKKINNCQYIKSIKREPLFNGFDRIIVTYGDDGKVYGRRIYTVTHN